MHHYENTEEFAYNQSTGKRQYHRKSHHCDDKPLTTGDKLLMSIGVIGGFIMILQEMVKVAFS